MRVSRDLDIFHDTSEAIEPAARQDAEILTANAVVVVWETERPGIRQATAMPGSHQTRLDWVHDSAFRFFPVQRDDLFGYCLHRADLAVNKVLALANRTEVRDYLDVLELHRTCLSFGAMVWAACAIDPGLTPRLILDQTSMHSRFQKESLEELILTRPADLVDLKRQWLAARAEAEALFERLPEIHLGCLYVDKSGNPVTPNPDDPAFKELIPHFGRPFGSWPELQT